jgi:hypothetical protein
MQVWQLDYSELYGARNTLAEGEMQACSLPPAEKQNEKLRDQSEITDQPALMHTADAAMRLEAAREQWLTLQTKLFMWGNGIPSRWKSCETQR